jgi:hypothetical protein
MPWFAVRHLISYEGAFEERITLWERQSSDEAFAAAKKEAVEWVEGIDGDVLDLWQSFEMFQPPGDGAECFSLIRDSDLDHTTYIDRFFSTGAEHQRSS